MEGADSLINYLPVEEKTRKRPDNLFWESSTDRVCTASQAVAPLTTFLTESITQ